MKRLSIYIFLFATICWSTATFAQADISMATHWYNRANYNPASIVRPDYIYLFSNVQKRLFSTCRLRSLSTIIIRHSAFHW